MKHILLSEHDNKIQKKILYFFKNKHDPKNAVDIMKS